MHLLFKILSLRKQGLMKNLVESTLGTQNCYNHLKSNIRILLVLDIGVLCQFPRLRRDQLPRAVTQPLVHFVFYLILKMDLSREEKRELRSCYCDMILWNTRKLVYERKRWRYKRSDRKWLTDSYICMSKFLTQPLNNHVILDNLISFSLSLFVYKMRSW